MENALHPDGKTMELVIATLNLWQRYHPNKEVKFVDGLYQITDRGSDDDKRTTGTP